MSFKALIARGNNHDAVRSFTHGRMVTAAELQQEIDIKRNGAYIDGLTGRSRRQLSISVMGHKGRLHTIWSRR